MFVFYQIYFFYHESIIHEVCLHVIDTEYKNEETASLYNVSKATLDVAGIQDTNTYV